MRATAARVTLLMLFAMLFLQAKTLFNDQIISPKASNLIETIGNELSEKTGIHAYVVATVDRLGRGMSLYKALEKYRTQMSTPYVVLFFAPNSKRIGVLTSDKSLKDYYDKDRVIDYAIGIIGAEDKNSEQSKYDVGIVQAFSELADEIAEHKGVTLKHTIKSSGGWIITAITWAVYLGALLVFWVYFGRPIYQRIRYGKQQ